MITVSGLSVSIGEKEVVKDINFTIEKGKTLGVVGESGSGKSMLALALLDLLPNRATKTQKEITLDGAPIHRKKRGESIGMIFQEPMNSLNPLMSVGDQILEALSVGNNGSLIQKEKELNTLLERVKLLSVRGIADRYPHELSGGQKQRVMIAMAISRNPQLLIADEPTTALDVTVQYEIIALIKDLQISTGMSVLFISHDLKVVKQIAHKCLVMKKGEQIEYEEINTLFNKPQKAYTKALLHCRPAVDFRYKVLPVVEDFTKGNSKVFVREKIEERSMRQETIYSKTPVLELSDVSAVFYKKKGLFSLRKEAIRILDKINIKLYQGESLGLIGESGSGKTTIGKVVVGVLQNTTGEVTYKGKPISSFSKKQFKKDVQIIYQDPYSSLNPRISAGVAILEPMMFYSVAKTKKEAIDKTKELLLKVGLLKQDFYKYPHEFSGGQRQRVVIARALAAQPKVIVCDESVSALDVSNQAQILNLLKKIQEDYQLSYLFISHDLSVVKYFCDRMIVLGQTGTIEDYGECDDLYDNSTNEYTRKLIEAIPK